MPFTGDIFSLVEIKQHAQDLIKTLEQELIQTETVNFMPLPQLETALTQFFEVSEKIETQPELLNSSESDFSNISELGDYGLQLLAGLEQWVDAAQFEDKMVLQLSILSLAIWIHDHDGELQQLDNIVNALSQLANHTYNLKVLIKLHKIVEKITNSAHKIIKSDLDKTDPGRPWRLLNLNHGIIATRTHNTDIMNTVFEQLVSRLPDDAANFFADGMKQLDVIDYPEHVKYVMEQFYQSTNKPTLH